MTWLEIVLLALLGLSLVHGAFRELEIRWLEAYSYGLARQLHQAEDCLLGEGIFVRMMDAEDEEMAEKYRKLNGHRF